LIIVCLHITITNLNY